MRNRRRWRDDEQPSTDSSTHRAFATLSTFGIGFVVLLGVLLRLWGLGRAPINSDQATVGLMADEILSGRFSVFFWGQHYGGGEPYVVAGIFGIFGHSSFTLGIAPALLDGAGALLLWRIGRRVLSPAVGVGAGLLFWIWPEVFVQLSTVEWGFRWLALDCGLVVLLSALRIIDASATTTPFHYLDWAVFGLAIGVGWWATPEILYYAVPAVVMLCWSLSSRRRLSLAGAGFALVAAALGALPWLWVNVSRGFKSLHEEKHGLSNYLDHTRVLFDHALPLTLGLQLRASGAWILSTSFGVFLYTLALLCLLAELVSLAKRRRGGVLIGFCVFAPIMFSIAPTSAWEDDRYALYLAPVLCLLLVNGVTDLVSLVPKLHARRRSLRTAIATVLAIAAAVAMTIGAMVQIAPYRPNTRVASEATWTTWRSQPTTWLSPVISLLEAQHVHDLYTGYWTGQVIDFLSHQQITTTDVPFIRYRLYTDQVERSRAAWLFLDPTSDAIARANAGTDQLSPGCIRNPRGCLPPSILIEVLQAEHDAFLQRQIDGFTEILPVRPLSLDGLYARWHRGHHRTALVRN